MVDVFNTVRVDVEVSDMRVEVGRGGINSAERARTIPSGKPGGTRRKRPVLFNGSNPGRSTGYRRGVL